MLCRRARSEGEGIDEYDKLQNPHYYHQSKEDANNPLFNYLTSDIRTESEFASKFSEKAKDHSKNVGFEFSKRAKTCCRKNFNCTKCREWTKQRIPICTWLPNYKWRKWVARDITVGLTMGFILAPKSMAHAVLAQLPPIYGIYTVLFATLLYGFFGNIKWFSVSTAALPSLIFGNALLGSGANTDDYTKIAPLLTFFIGIVCFLMALFRLDKILGYVSPISLSAFTTAGAFLIGTTQVKYLFGIHFDSQVNGFFPTYVALFRQISETNFVALGLGICSILFLLFTKTITTRYGKKYGIPDPGAFLIVLITIGLSYWLEFHEKYNIKIVGYVPSGFPPILVPWDLEVSPDLCSTLFVDALLIALINYLMAMGVAKTVTEKIPDIIFDSKQELLALASVNLVGSFFGTFISGGSVSGTALLTSFESNSLIASFVSSIVMLIILMELTSLIQFLPKVTLACIIIVALPRLIDFKKPMRLYRVRPDECLIWCLTFITTLATGAKWGVVAGFIFSLISLVWRFTRSPVTEVGKIAGTCIYRSLDRFPDANRVEHLRIFRLDESINFGNARKFEKRIETLIFEALHSDNMDKPKKKSMFKRIKAKLKFNRQDRRSPDKIKADCHKNDVIEYLDPDLSIILSCEAVNDLDSVALEMLERLCQKCSKHNIHIYFSGFKIRVRETLHKFRNELKKRQSNSNTEGLPFYLDQSNWFLSLHDAVLQLSSEYTKGLNEQVDLPDMNQQSSQDSSDACRLTIQTVTETPVSNTHLNNMQPEGHTIEICHNGEFRSWNYADKNEIVKQTQPNQV